MAEFVCAECGQRIALLRTAAGRELCIECIEALPDHAGIDADSVEMMKVVNALSSAPPPRLTRPPQR